MLTSVKTGRLLPDAMAEASRLINLAIDDMLPAQEGEDGRLMQSMRYACFGGGKRLRPLLVLQTSALFGVAQSCAIRAAAAIEFLHCYSLVHDDLPAMDDSDLRRGRPTVHKAFDEAPAILAGDALLTLAFDIMARLEVHTDPNVRISLVSELARAAGLG